MNELLARSHERHPTVLVKLRTDGFTQEVAHRFVQELQFPGANAAIIEFMMTAKRFHSTFPTATSFILEYPSYNESIAGTPFECIGRPIKWHSRILNGEQSSVLDVSVPEKLARFMEKYGLNSHGMSLKHVSEIFAIEGARMQSAIAFGGKVLLRSGYDTGYSVISFGQQFHLTAQRFGLFDS